MSVQTPTFTDALASLLTVCTLAIELLHHGGKSEASTLGGGGARL